MSTTYTGSLAYPASITLPSDGDVRDAASVNVALEALADRTEYLKNGSSGSFYVSLDGPLVNVSSRWAAAFDGVSKFYWRQTNVTDDGGLIWHVPSHLDGRITDVLAVIDGDGGGAAHGAIPGAGDRPKIQLLKCAAGVFSTVGAAAEDPTTTLPNYEATHVFGQSGLTADFGPAVSYAVWLRGEKGVNAVAGALALYQISITIIPV